MRYRGSGRLAQALGLIPMFRARVIALLLCWLSPHAWGTPPPLVDPVIFNDVRFEPGQTGDKATLSAFQLRELRELSETLRYSPTVRVLIIGHADASEGSEAQCKAISESRALFVFDWLSAEGFGSQLKGHTGVCHTKSTNSSNTESLRRYNRRVEAAARDQA